MKIILSSGLMLLFVLAGTPAQALEPFVLLDDFLGDRIDNAIWNGSRRPDSDTVDVAREVQGGELRLMGRTYADAPLPRATNSDRVRLFLNNSGPVTQMAASFRVNAVEISGCTGSATASGILGRLAGYFFTTGGPPAPLDATRNIFVGIRVQRRSDSIDPPGVMEIGAQVFLCGDASCNTGTTLLIDTTTLGTVAVGESVTLAVAWEPENDRFFFARGFPLQFSIFNYNGILTDGNPPSPDLSFVHKRMELRANIENCVTQKLEKLVQSYNEDATLEIFLEELEEIKNAAINRKKFASEKGMNNYEFSIFNFVKGQISSEDALLHYTPI